MTAKNIGRKYLMIYYFGSMLVIFLIPLVIRLFTRINRSQPLNLSSVFKETYKVSNDGSSIPLYASIVILLIGGILYLAGGWLGNRILLKAKNAFWSSFMAIVFVWTLFAVGSHLYQIAQTYFSDYYQKHGGRLVYGYATLGLLLNIGAGVVLAAIISPFLGRKIKRAGNS
ncbi:MAG: hypothetical protein P8O05_12935 [Flavobacteriales bacterium]|nr:hypothetical protein [Flavobacteriales bacterium]